MILGLLKSWTVSVTGWNMNWKSIFSEHTSPLCHVISQPQWIISLHREQIGKRFPRIPCRISRAAACCFRLLCSLFREVEDTSQTRVPQTAHLTSQTMGSGSLRNLGFPQICPGSLSSVFTTAHGTSSLCLSMNKGAGHHPAHWTCSHIRTAGEENLAAAEEGQCRLPALDGFTQQASWSCKDPVE